MNKQISLLKVFTTLLLLMLFAQASQAQCPTGLLHLQSQVDVDNFSVQYPNCTSLPDGLLIGIYPSGNDVNNLDALSQITSIGDLEIYNSSLTDCVLPNLQTVNDLLFYGNSNMTSLSGLSKLTTISGDFSLENNTALSSLSGLSMLNSITGDLHVKGNVVMATLGLSQLTTAGSLDIEGNTGLTNLDLPLLSTVNGVLSLFSNAALVDIDLPELDQVSALQMNSLMNLTSVSLPNLGTVQALSIGETSLNSLSGLSNLNTISGDCYIRKNINLVNLSGLSSLNTISGDLYVYENDNLINFSGLSNLNTINILRVYKNSKLENFVGLENLHTVTGMLIGDLPVGNINLTSLQGLSGLETGGYVYILNNPKLTNLNPLTNLVHVLGISLSNNGQLSDISGLANMIPSELTYVTIKDNANLSVCNIESVCNYLSTSNPSFMIENNKVGCASYNEVALACNPSSNLLVTCPDSILVAVPTGASSVVVNWDEPSVATNCSSGTTVNLTSNIASGSILNIGSYTVTYTATDDCSNSETCSFLVTVGSSPAAFEISTSHCPSTYPNSGDDYILDFEVTNTGGLPSEPTNLQLAQGYYQAGNYTYDLKGSVSIPSIAPGATYVGNQNFGAIVSYPGDFTLNAWNAFFFDTLTLRTNYGPGQNNYEAKYNLFCKKFDSELKVEVSADSYLIDTAGVLEYDITISNLGTELAANIMTHVGPPKWGKNIFTLSNLPAEYQTFQSKDNEEDLFLRLPLLAAGASESFHVKVKIQGAIDSIFEPFVYAYSHHQINDEIYYDETAAKFFRSAVDLSVTNLTNLPDTAFVGDVVNYNFDLNNLGNITALDEYRIGMYLSTDSIYDAADIAVGEIVTAATPVGTIGMVPASIAVPSTLSAGDYYLFVVADTEGAIAEANENNNELSKKITLQLPTGLEDVGQSVIAIVPNPATDFVRIVTAKKIDKVLIYNAFGELVLETTEQAFSVANLPEGLYATVVYMAGEAKVSYLVKAE